MGRIADGDAVLGKSLDETDQIKKAALQAVANRACERRLIGAICRR